MSRNIRPRGSMSVDKPVSIVPVQNLGYYEGQSPDFCLQFVPEDARRVLDIGCGRGWLGKKLKERGPIEVVGIEHFPEAAEEARRYLDTVYAADVEAVEFDYPAGYFDCIVYSGVLEHVLDPWYLLFEHRRLLKDGGAVVALLPNVQHFSVLLGLLQGRWSYQPSGQLDATHYRFFTRHEIVRMFKETGFRMGPMAGYRLFDPPPEVGKLADALKTTGLATPEFLQDMEVYIWVLRAHKLANWQPAPRQPQPVHIPGVGTIPAPPATPAPQPPAPEPQAAPADSASVEASVIIVSYNSKKDLEQCLASIANHSRIRHEVIVVDNASPDGTAEWLRTRANVRLIANADNRGYSAAANQGIQAARGAYCILLNPDTIVTDGWDARLLAHARQAGVGAVGPISHGACCGWQRIQMWLREQMDGEQNIRTVAGKLAEWYPGQAHETKLLTGFCLCVPKRVFDDVGLLDEDLFIGNDDVDLSLRLRWGGYKLLVALDTFVLHKGMQSFTGMPDRVRGRYIQESTDRLYAKLEEKFGEGQVPSWPELLDLPWHLPTHLRGDIFTGERANPHSPNMLPDIMKEHWARYELARPHARGKRVLDVACGTGYGSAHLAEVAAHVTACDLDVETLHYARAKSARLNLAFAAGDVSRLPLAARSFDVITSFETIEHVENGRAVLEEFARLLTEDGALLISTPLGSEDGNPYHLSHYNRADFFPLLQEFFGEVELRYQEGAAIYDEPRTPPVADRFMGEYAIAICRKPRVAAGVPSMADAR